MRSGWIARAPAYEGTQPRQDLRPPMDLMHVAPPSVSGGQPACKRRFPRAIRPNDEDEQAPLARPRPRRRSHPRMVLTPLTTRREEWGAAAWPTL